VSIQQTLIRSLGDEPVPPPPILGMVLTSGLYPIVDDGDAVSMGCAPAPTGILLTQFFGLEPVDLNAVPQAITLVATITFKNYTFWPFESANLAASTPQAPTLTDTIVFKNYTFWPAESVNMSATPAGGSPITLVAAISFVNTAMGPESANMAATPGSITLV
jgi:hypothetical protein